jgi:hypothetical protein
MWQRVVWLGPPISLFASLGDAWVPRPVLRLVTFAKDVRSKRVISKVRSPLFLKMERNICTRTLCDFRLPPRCKLDLGCCGMLRSVDLKEILDIYFLIYTRPSRSRSSSSGLSRPWFEEPKRGVTSQERALLWPPWQSTFSCMQIL